MSKPELLSRTDLHVHVFGAYTPADLVEMAKDVYQEIDWDRFDFRERFARAYGDQADPVRAFARALATGDTALVERLAVCGPDDAGDFERFDVKSFFSIAVTGYYIDRGEHVPVLAPLFRRQDAEGLRYVEYRCGFGPSIFADWHSRVARYFAAHSQPGREARSIVRLSTADALGSYLGLRELLVTRPDLYDAIVGVDFSGREVPPRLLADFFARLHADNAADPAHTLDAVVHIGEVFYDRTLETAVRWCHEAAELGAARLGHCIALGIDPALATGRRPDAHTGSTVRERMDQIDYDLAHASALRSYGVTVDRERLLAERSSLERRTDDEIVHSAYDQRRLDEVARRQDYVLDRLAELGTVIEVCPTSNLRIAGIPAMEGHPVWRLLKSSVRLAICTDDPGVFDTSLAAEVEMVATGYPGGLDALAARLGDPYDYGLAQGRRA